MRCTFAPRISLVDEVHQFNEARIQPNGSKEIHSCSET
jgi:hypothetical protein